MPGYGNRRKGAGQASTEPPETSRWPPAAAKAAVAAVRQRSTTSGSLSASPVLPSPPRGQGASAIPMLRFIFGSYPHPFLDAVIGANDAGHERVANYVRLREMHKGDPGNPVENLHRVSQARAGSLRQIDLAEIAGDDHPGVFSQSRQEHFHLHGSRVLRLVEDDEGVGERPSAHERERSTSISPLSSRLITCGAGSMSYNAS